MISLHSAQLLSALLTLWATLSCVDPLRLLRRRTPVIEGRPESILAVDLVVHETVKIPDGLLSSRQALVLELLYKRDMTPGEAAEVIGIDPQTVRSMHHKALVKLRAHFQAELGEAGAPGG